MNLSTLLIDHPFPDDEPLLSTVDRTVTAGQARRQAHDFAARFAEAGVQPGQAVAVQMRNAPEFICALAGVWLAGAAFVPVNPRASEMEVGGIVDAIRPSVILRGDDVTRLPHPASVGEGLAFILWTSGTTGPPKAIHHTHAGYLELLDRVLEPLRGSRLQTKRPAPNLIPVSLSLNAGLYNSLFGLRAGAAVVIMDRFSTKEFAELVRRFGIRSTVLPPAALSMLAADPEVTDLEPLRIVRSITAPLSPLQAELFASKFGVTILNGYGQAEMGEVIGWTVADARSYPDKLGAVGRPHPGVTIKLDPSGQLHVRPPNVAAGLEDRMDDEGFVATGDIAHLDADGFVWIEGRVSDLINRGGNKIFPGAVEEVLRLAPSITDAAVVGMPDSRLGQVPVAFLVGEPIPDTSLVALCREHLAPYKVPVEFRWVDALPRNEVGKVLMSALLELASPRGVDPG
jgi:acyl-coenzyme A synthetase/AMP-(fatty) acid ligase